MLCKSDDLLKPWSLPICKNFDFLWSYISSLLKFSKFLRFLIIECFISAAILSGSLCAPPKGSGMISSIIFNFKRSFAVSYIASAACKDFVGSRQSIEAHPSGEITE